MITIFLFCADPELATSVSCLVTDQLLNQRSLATFLFWTALQTTEFLEFLQWVQVPQTCRLLFRVCWSLWRLDIGKKPWYVSRKCEWAYEMRWLTLIIIFYLNIKQYQIFYWCVCGFISRGGDLGGEHWLCRQGSHCSLLRPIVLIATSIGQFNATSDVCCAIASVSRLSRWVLFCTDRSSWSLAYTICVGTNSSLLMKL